MSNLKATNNRPRTTDQIRFVYFDIDDTLLDHRGAERQALADCCAHFADTFGALPVPKVQATYHAHNQTLWARYADGAIGREELQHLRFHRLLCTLDLDDLEPAAFGTHYLERYAVHWTFPDAARRAFRTVADRFPVGLLTNGFAEVQRAKLDRFPELRERAAAIVISEDVGFMKPHPSLFAHAAEQANVPAEAILYVGNSYRSDVVGGRTAGWQVAWYTAAEDSEAPTPLDGVFHFDEWDALLFHLDL